MAANTTPIFPATPHIAAQTFANSDGTSEKTVITAGANGTLLQAIVISSNDTVDHTASFWLNDGTTDHYLGAVAVPHGSGYTTVARVSAMGTLAPFGTTIQLPTSWLLKAAMDVAVTSADVVTILASGGDY